MPNLQRVFRYALLSLLAVASLNGVMVFLLFDGTNFLTHRYYLWMKEEVEARNSAQRSQAENLEKRIRDARKEGRIAYEKQAASLEKAYGWLDTVLHSSHFLHRRPIAGKYVQAEFRTEHPFKTTDKTLAICGGGSCFYEENLPEYAKTSRPDVTRDLLKERMAAYTRVQSAGYFPMVFSLIRKSGPFELWKAYWKVSDSTYEYHANYLIHVGSRRLLKRDVEVHGESAYMGEASVSGRFLILHYGCCHGMKDLSILTEAGGSILEASYIGKVSWTGDTLVYFRPEPEAAHSHDKCASKGRSSHPGRKTFFIEGKTVDAGETELFCGH